MPSVVITGAPGSGKTTLLNELARLGHDTMPESARAVIAERRAAGLSPRPEPLAFARELHRRDVASYHAVGASTRWVFFDRSAVESLGMVQDLDPLPKETLDRLLASHVFHRTVFLLPPWEAIYVTDAERDHDFEHALRVHASLARWYEACGYRLQEVPCLAPRDRAAFVLDVLASDA